jgi:hypothetical protein
MFLMFNLHRPDVLPVDDLGVRNAVGRLYKMNPAPTAKELREFGERWRPYRSVASWYLWQSYNIITPDGAVAATDGAAKKATAKPPTPIPRRLVVGKARAITTGAGKTNARKTISLKASAAKTTRSAPEKLVAVRKTRAQTGKKS